VKRLRNIARFPDAGQLMAQIARDVEQCRGILAAGLPVRSSL